MTTRLILNFCVAILLLFNIELSVCLRTNKISNWSKDNPQTYVDVSSLTEPNVSTVLTNNTVKDFYSFVSLFQ